MALPLVQLSDSYIDAGDIQISSQATAKLYVKSLQDVGCSITLTISSNSTYFSFSKTSSVQSITVYNNVADYTDWIPVNIYLNAGTTPGFQSTTIYVSNYVNLSTQQSTALTAPQCIVSFDIVNLSKVIIVTRTSIDFGQVKVGGQVNGGGAATADLVIMNSLASTSSTAINITLSGPAAPFSIVSDTAQASLTPGQARTITIQAAPTAVGTANSSLSITHDATNMTSPITINLSVVGVSYYDFSTASYTMPDGSLLRLDLRVSYNGSLSGYNSNLQQQGVDVIEFGALESRVDIEKLRVEMPTATVRLLDRKGFLESLIFDDGNSNPQFQAAIMRSTDGGF